MQFCDLDKECERILLGKEWVLQTVIIFVPCSFSISASLFTDFCLILFVNALKKHLPSLLSAENNSALNST
jgi:hypothetical protein